MAPFIKIKHIRVSEGFAFYTIELECPRCGITQAQTIKLAGTHEFSIKKIDWYGEHVCEVAARDVALGIKTKKRAAKNAN